MGLSRHEVHLEVRGRRGGSARVGPTSSGDAWNQSAVLAPCEGLEGAFGPATPQRLGAVVLEEALSGKLTPGLEPSKAFHDLS